MQGYIKLYRKIWGNEFWCERRKKTKLEAWIDLLLMANYEKRDVSINNTIVHIKRGELLTSQVGLADKWRWNRATVKTFLLYLQTSNAITFKTTKTYIVSQ